MKKKDSFKQLELTGTDLDNFIERVVDKLYNDIWRGIPNGPGEIEVKDKLRESISEALNEFTDYQSDG